MTWQELLLHLSSLQKIQITVSKPNLLPYCSFLPVFISIASLGFVQSDPTVTPNRGIKGWWWWKWWDWEQECLCEKECTKPWGPRQSSVLTVFFFFLVSTWGRLKNNLICVESKCVPHVDLQHSITATLRGRKEAVKWRKWDKHLNTLGGFFSPHISKWTASPLPFIFVLPPAACWGKVKTWKIGYTQGILSPDTLHLPPDTKETCTTGAGPPPQIHEPGSSAAGFQMHSLQILVPEERDKLTFECFLSLENHNYCEWSVHLSMSAQRVSSPTDLSPLFRGKPVERDNIWIRDVSACAGAAAASAGEGAAGAGWLRTCTRSLRPLRSRPATAPMAACVAFGAERCDMQAFTPPIGLSHTHLHTFSLPPSLPPSLLGACH